MTGRMAPVTVEAPPGAAVGAARVLKIDVVVQGRFHAFEMAKAFARAGHDVVLLTNYPRRVVERFGFPGERTRTFVAHGILARLAVRFPLLPRERVEAWLHTAFGRWAARTVRMDADLVYGLSSTLVELLDARSRVGRPFVVLCRGSAHIGRQDALLRDEERRVAAPVSRPTAWMVAREMREYEKADLIAVLSRFAQDSFLACGVPARKLVMHPLGLDLQRFLASEADLSARIRRIESGGRLRVLTVGTMSYQKGAFDLVAMARALRGTMEFRFVGDVPAETKRLSGGDHGIEIIGRVPEEVLPRHYGWADVFLFPTIQDGFAAVLLQAAAAGLPILATRNSSAPDLVVEGENGWVVDARDQAAMLRRLAWCNDNRAALAAMVRPAANRASALGWDVVAGRFLADVATAQRASPGDEAGPRP